MGLTRWPGWLSVGKNSARPPASSSMAGLTKAVPTEGDEDELERERKDGQRPARQAKVSSNIIAGKC